MAQPSRRTFAAAAAAAGLPAPAQTSIDAVLRQGAKRRGIPCVTAVVADSRRVLYSGAFGTRDADSGAPVTPHSVFRIASMTKAITSLAALQFVEQGKVTLDEPVEKHLPELRGRQVLDGFESNGRARLRPPATPVTLRHLLSHTSGLCYALWDSAMVKWQSSPGVTASTPQPLMFDPGSRWQYGQGIDVAGRLVEALSGLSLEAYFQKHILGPLQMRDTSYLVPSEKFERVVTPYTRQAGGALHPIPRRPPDRPRSFGGGGGLYSTAPDYARFLQAILRSAKSGAGPVSANTYKLMAANQIGDIRAGVLKSTDPATSSDVDTHPGASDRHTLAWIVNPEPHAGGRAANSFSWAGLHNTFYWIDPANDRCAVLLMQFLPFVDREAVGLLGDFERAVYAA